MRRTRCIMLVLLSFLAASALGQKEEPSKMIYAGEDRIEGEYLVILADDVKTSGVLEAANQLAFDHGASVEKVWSDAIHGFFAKMSAEQAEELSKSPLVKSVEENAAWYFSATQQTNVNPILCDPTAGPCPTVVDDRLWHLDRADQNYASPNNTYSYCTTGSGVTVYVVDTGVNKFHQEFTPGQVKKGYNPTGDFMDADDPCLGFPIPPAPGMFFEGGLFTQEILGRGHGTSVASALAGKRVGIANGVSIVPIKVARCDKQTGRNRISNQLYQQNDVIYRSPNNGFSAGTELYRALNSGFTAAADPSGWPTADNATMQDGGITWINVPFNDWSPTNTTATTQMLADGLNWILSAGNPGPKSHAVVTLSTYRVATESGVSAVELAIRSLLANNITVIASANNQNGNACDTTPARMSLNNPDPAVRGDVITAGGSMIINRPWGVDISDVAGPEADGPRPSPFSPWGLEPAYDPTKAVRDGRWICGPGDSSILCSNTTVIQSPNPASSSTYTGFQGGSNAGACVTLFAPAKNLFLATNESASTYRDARVRGGHASGTSWSAPIVAGFAARLLQSTPNLTPQQIRGALLNNSAALLDPATLNTFDHLGNPITGTPNQMLRLGDVNITDQPDSTAANVTGTTPLTVAAGGTTAVSYQWYEVNANFDYATYQYGAHSSTPIAGATSTTFNAPASPVRKAYWVRATSSCGSADSNIAVVVPRPGAPSNTNAVANGTSVTVTWSAGSGAETYRIERKVAGQPWTQAGEVSASVFSFTESPVAAGGMVVYRVLSAAGSQYLPGVLLSASSNNDFANLNSHTYEPLATPPAYTTVKAQMLIELRQAVNGLCNAVGAPLQFTPAELLLSSLQTKIIEDEYFTTLMTRINNIRTNPLLGMAAASFTNTPAPLALIRREHLQSLRDALK